MNHGRTAAARPSRREGARKRMVVRPAAGPAGHGGAPEVTARGAARGPIRPPRKTGAPVRPRSPARRTHATPAGSGRKLAVSRIPTVLTAALPSLLAAACIPTTDLLGQDG